jgi:hypothetical protein
MRRDAGAKFSRSREEDNFTGGTYQRDSDGNTTLRSSSRWSAMAKRPRDESHLAVDPWDCAVQRPKQQLQARRRRALLVGTGHLGLPRADDRIQSLRCESCLLSGVVLTGQHAAPRVEVESGMWVVGCGGDAGPGIMVIISRGQPQATLHDYVLYAGPTRSRPAGPQHRCKRASVRTTRESRGAREQMANGCWADDVAASRVCIASAAGMGHAEGKCRTRTAFCPLSSPAVFLHRRAPRHKAMQKPHLQGHSTTLQP